MDFIKKHYKLISIGLVVLLFCSLLASCIGCMSRPRVQPVYVQPRVERGYVPQGGYYDDDYYEDDSYRRGYGKKRDRYYDKRDVRERRKIKIKSRRLKNPFRSSRSKSRGGRR
jgi:hypothetical protein